MSDPLKNLLRGVSRDQTAEIPATVPLPKDWQPRVVESLKEIEAVSELMPLRESDPTNEELLELFGVDGDRWEVSNFRRSKWQTPNGEWLESFRASFKPYTGIPRADVDELLKVVQKWKPKKPPAPPVTPPAGQPEARTDYAFVVNLSDWQIGKGEGGGSAATVERVMALGPAVEARVKELRRSGRVISELVVHGLGDLVEGCDGFYAMQAFQADLDRRGQLKVTWRLLAELLKRWAPLAPKITVAAVAGNHGENRRNGKAYTTFADNDDLVVFEIVADVLKGVPGFEHVKFMIPEDRLSLVHDVAGVWHGLAHGHQFSRGATASAKAADWWKAQAFGINAMMHAQILVSAHFHHFAATEYSENGRTHFQTPAMDGGSQWYAAGGGGTASPGTLTYLCGSAAGPRGWRDLAVI